MTDYITQALESDPSVTPGETGTELDTAAASRPLPDEHQAAALWWRLVPHLGPAALDADEHSANLLQPTWRTTLAELVGTTKADYLQKAPAWPALVAAVDEACQHHGWTPRDILTSALTGVPQDGTLTGVEVADALVLRIAMLTDQPADQPPMPDHDDAAPFPETDVPPTRTCSHPTTPTTPTPTTSPSSTPPPRPTGRRPSTTPTCRRTTTSRPPTRPLTRTCRPCRGSRRTRSPPSTPSPPRTRSRPSGSSNSTSRHWPTTSPATSGPGRPRYLRERLGTDLTDHPTFTAGHAPSGPRSLLTHLTSPGASLDELEQAGLIRNRDRRDGTTEYVDAFRDRLIMPIRDPHDRQGQAIVGFIGRRNPTKTDDDYAGPKYLNTRTTPVFTKGEALFGYAETRELLANGALPVIVEGPMDALAITLGSNGAAVGIAPMGTALTVNQIKLLRTNIDLVNGRDRIAVATDADTAGWKAAQTAFWNLTAADLDPTHLELPDGLDPAKLFETQGEDAITAPIENRAPLGDAMIDHLLRTAGHWSDPAVRQKIIEQAARVLGARGSETWLDATARLRNRLHLAPGILEHQTITESMDRDRNRSAYTQARIAELQDQARARLARRDPESRRRAAGQRLATATAPTRPEHYVPPEGLEPDGPAR